MLSASSRCAFAVLFAGLTACAEESGTNVPDGGSQVPDRAPPRPCDDETDPGTVQFSAATVGVDENAGEAILTVTRLQGCGGALVVEYFVVEGAATEGVDYSGAMGMIEWQDGETADQTFAVTIVDAHDSRR